MMPQLSLPDNCCGCKACANACPKNAISFDEDQYGIYYPKIDEEKCIGCNKCLKICDFKKDEVIGNTPIDGYAARHKSFDIYRRSTSGGIFTALSEYIINKDGMVFGCAFDENLNPKHVKIKQASDLSRLRGSKYVQSDMGHIYGQVKDVLEKDRYVLFSGTPCQVAALNSYLTGTDTSKLYTIDVICSGTPNAKVFKKYIDYLQNKHSCKIEMFYFRDKRFEWERPTITIDTDKGSKWWFTTEDAYYENFLKGNMQRPSCFNCKYSTTTRCGDITIGDFWGWQKANLSMVSKKGISCCLLNTTKAQSLFSELDVECEKVPTELIIAGNPRLQKCPKIGTEWDSVMKSIKNDGFENIVAAFKKRHRKAYMKSFVKKLVLKKLKP